MSFCLILFSIKISSTRSFESLISVCTRLCTEKERLPDNIQNIACPDSLLIIHVECQAEEKNERKNVSEAAHYNTGNESCVSMAPMIGWVRNNNLTDKVEYACDDVEGYFIGILSVRIYGQLTEKCKGLSDCQ